MKRGGRLRRRTGVRRVSARAAAELDVKRDVRMAVFDRDRGRCLLADRPETGPCSGRWEAHHVEKAWKGGEYSLRTLVTLCAGHNLWVENNPLRAWGLGLVVRMGETHEMAAERRRECGLERTP